MKIICAILWLMLVVSCDSFKPHQPNPYFESLKKSNKIDTIRFDNGKKAIICYFDSKKRAEGLARIFCGNGDEIQKCYFKEDFPCYRPDILSDFKEMEYTIDSGSSQILTVGDTFELKFTHNDLFPYGVTFKVGNGMYTTGYDSSWALSIIPTGGDCYVSAYTRIGRHEMVPFFDHVFKTRSKSKSSHEN
jgi:hypothetical protein